MKQKQQSFDVVVKALEKCLVLLHKAKLTNDQKLWVAREMVRVLELTGAPRKLRRPAS
jgi:hypothetical protein